MMFESESCAAKPIAMPATPIPVRAAVTSTPSCPRAMTSPKIITAMRTTLSIRRWINASSSPTRSSIARRGRRAALNPTQKARSTRQATTSRGRNSTVRVRIRFQSIFSRKSIVLLGGSGTRVRSLHGVHFPGPHPRDLDLHG